MKTERGVAMMHVRGMGVAIWIALAAWIGMLAPAWAQGTGAETVAPGVLTTTGCPPAQPTCWKPYSSTNPLPVTGTSTAPIPVTGFDSGAVAATATPANSSHAAGTSVGGLFAVPLARINGGSGILTSVTWKSVGGSTGTLVLRIWQKSPANTTCTDNTAFAGSDTDDAFLITPPFSLTPAAPAVTTGDTATYAVQLGMTVDYLNVDTSASKNLYVCAVTVATDTADQNKLVRLMLSGPQN